MDEEALELKRQGIHLINGCCIAVAVYLLKPLIGLWVLAPLLVALFVLHTAPRLSPKNQIMLFLMHHFERRKDIAEFPFKGAIHFGYGIIFPILLLDASSCCAVIMVLSVGDSVSTLVGRRWGSHRIGKKSVEGSLAFLSSSWIAASAFVGSSHAFFLASGGTLIELFLPWDDNITIPAGLSIVSRVYFR